MSPLPKVPGTGSARTPSNTPKAPLMPPMEPPPGMHQQIQQPMRAWDTPGQKVIAYFLGLRDSTKYAGRKLVDLMDDDGVVETWPAPVILEQLLRGVESRTPVLIYYRGEDGDTKQFDVFINNTTRKE